MEENDGLEEEGSRFRWDGDTSYDGAQRFLMNDSKTSSNYVYHNMIHMIVDGDDYMIQPRDA